jgi:hypothetical protein
LAPRNYLIIIRLRKKKNEKNEALHRNVFVFLVLKRVYVLYYVVSKITHHHVHHIHSTVQYIFFVVVVNFLLSQNFRSDLCRYGFMWSYHYLLYATNATIVLYTKLTNITTTHCYYSTKNWLYNTYSTVLTER